MEENIIVSFLKYVKYNPKRAELIALDESCNELKLIYKANLGSEFIQVEDITEVSFQFKFDMDSLVDIYIKNIPDDKEWKRSDFVNAIKWGFDFVAEIIFAHDYIRLAETLYRKRGDISGREFGII